MNVHFFTDLSQGKVYDLSQTSDAIKDGDVLVASDGIAVMYKAWPVIINGQPNRNGFHASEPAFWLNDGKTYLQSARHARKIGIELGLPDSAMLPES